MILTKDDVIVVFVLPSLVSCTTMALSLLGFFLNGKDDADHDQDGDIKEEEEDGDTSRSRGG
jgi:hypothetical protein